MEALNIAVAQTRSKKIKEEDDLMRTIVKIAEQESFEIYMNGINEDIAKNIDVVKKIISENDNLVNVDNLNDNGDSHKDDYAKKPIIITTKKH